MNRIGSLTLLVMAACLAVPFTYASRLSFAGEPAAEDKSGGASGDATGEARDTEGYVVKEGDTLWDISRANLNDPYQWEKVWKENPDIADPDLIYPGEKIKLPGGEAAKEGMGESRGASLKHRPPAEPAERPFVDMGHTLERLPEVKEQKVIVLDQGEPPKPPLATESEMLSAGFIIKDIEGAKKITGSPEGVRNVYSSLETVYIEASKSMKKGDRLMIFRPEEEVYNPETDEDLGHKVVVSGVLRVTGRKDPYFEAVIESSFSEILNTDLLLPMPRVTLTYPPYPKNASLKGVSGYIVSTQGDKKYNVTTSIVYLNIGSDRGVEPGDEFIVKRPGGETTVSDRRYIIPKHRELPWISVGDVQVVSVQPESCTARVIEFTEAVNAGYKVYYKD